MKFRYLVAALLLPLPAAAADLDVALGKALFDRPWTSAPSSTLATDGLGPLFNARSCVACHKGGGRGDIKTRADGNAGGTGFVIRIGNKNGNPDPVYGAQLQTHGVQGFAGEGQVFFRKNTFHIEDLRFGTPTDSTKMAARLSQPLHGLGLLEQVPDTALEALADPEDTNGDGISGRINRLEDGRIGRFSWKAAAPDLRTQTANAFLNDIGMSTPIHPRHEGDCTSAQPACINAPHGDSPQFDGVEISGDMLRLVTVYLQNLRAPKSVVSEDGLALFAQTGCAGCHMPSLPLANGGTVAAYTDLLLHDMGAGLEDGIKEASATGNEWRTQPLWGIRTALAKGQRLLHDGRADSIAGAIQWHGGEAANARANFNQLNDEDQQRLIDFVGNL